MCCRWDGMNRGQNRLLTFGSWVPFLCMKRKGLAPPARMAWSSYTSQSVTLLPEVDRHYGFTEISGLQYPVWTFVVRNTHNIR